METTQNPRTQEFSRVFKLSELTGEAARQRLTATAAERAAVASRLGLLDMMALEANLVLRRGPVAGTYIVAGRVTAGIVQACVVTLAPVESRLEADFETVYAADALAAAEGAGAADGGDAAEAPEIVVDGRIDLGEEVVQQLACAIDPYPRAAGAEIDPRWRREGDETPDSGPFAALAKVRREP